MGATLRRLMGRREEPPPPPPPIHHHHHHFISPNQSQSPQLNVLEPPPHLECPPPPHLECPSPNLSLESELQIVSSESLQIVSLPPPPREESPGPSEYEIEPVEESGLSVSRSELLSPSSTLPGLPGNVIEPREGLESLKELSEEEKEGAVYIGASTVDVKLSFCFNEAKERAKVPFLHHQVLECGYNGIDFTIEDHDITVRIPEGAVAEGEKIHFEVGVATYGPFAFSENSRPISPILWLCILDKDVQLKREFMIILPHILTGLTTDKLRDHQVTFAKANHDDYTLEGGKMAYRFNQYEIQPFFASVEDKSYGILLSSHCCFYCIKAQQSPELARDAGYCLARIESLTSEIYFVASFFLKSCVTAWKEQFSEEKGFRILRCVGFKFKTDGTTDPCIKIVPQYSPQQCDIAMEPSRAEIKLSEIDFWMKRSTFDTMLLKHEEKMYPPNVKMTITRKSNDVTKLPIKITGCLDEGLMDMDIPLQSATGSAPTARALSNTSQNGSPDVIMPDEKPKLKDALKAVLAVAAHWKIIGTFLGVESHVLHEISNDEKGVKNQLREVLARWLNQCIPSPTWRALADSVANVNRAKAKSIMDRFATQ